MNSRFLLCHCRPILLWPCIQPADATGLVFDTPRFQSSVLCDTLLINLRKVFFWGGRAEITQLDIARPDNEVSDQTEVLELAQLSRVVVDG